MKVKLGDLTLSQFHKICGETEGCDHCPFYDPSANYTHCMADYADKMDREVEVDLI